MAQCLLHGCTPKRQGGNDTVALAESRLSTQGDMKEARVAVVQASAGHRKLSFAPWAPHHSRCLQTSEASPSHWGPLSSQMYWVLNPQDSQSVCVAGRGKYVILGGIFSLLFGIHYNRMVSPFTVM